MEDRLSGGLAAEHVRAPLEHLTVSLEWLSLHKVWLAARDVWELGDQEAAAEKKAPDAGALRKAFAPILAYRPKTALEWAEKMSLAEYRGHLSDQGAGAILWADAAHIGIYAADRRVMSRGGPAAAVVSAYHTREGLRSQHGAHPEGSPQERAVLQVWDDTTRLILGARSSDPAIVFSQLRLILDAEISPIEDDESTRSALAPLLAAAAAQHLDQS
jgi:hypothetical protein